MATRAEKTSGRVIEPTTLPADNDQVAAINAIELVRMRDGVSVTSTLAIAHEFGRRHSNVLRTLDSLIADGTIGRLNFEETSYTDEWNRQQRAYELTERGALVCMPFVGGRKSRVGQVRLVDAFLSIREEHSGNRAADAHVAPPAPEAAPAPTLPDRRIAEVSLGVLALDLIAGSRHFKFSESDHLNGLHKLMRKNGLPVEILPPLDPISACAASSPPVSCRFVHRFEVVEAVGCMTVAEVATVLRCADLVDVLIEAGALDLDGMPNSSYVEIGMLAIGFDLRTGKRVALFTGEGQVWIARRFRAGRIH